MITSLAFMPPVDKKFIRGRFVPTEDNTMGGVLVNTLKNLLHKLSYIRV